MDEIQQYSEDNSQEEDKSYYGGISKYPEHITNPFVEEAIQNVQIKTRYRTLRSSNKKASQLVVDNDGVVMASSVFSSVIEVDEERFVKIFLRDLTAFWHLSKPAQRVLTYIWKKLEKDTDEFIFIMKEAMAFTAYKQPKQIFAGLSQLIDIGLIARTDRSWAYYINPLFCWNGSRVVFAKEYHIKKKEQQAAREAAKIEAAENQLTIFDVPKKPHGSVFDALPAQRISTQEMLENKKQLLLDDRLTEEAKKSFLEEEEEII